MNPHADSVQQPSEAELLYLWDTYVGDPTAKYPFTDDDKVVFARAVLARFGTRPAAEPVTDEMIRAGAKATFDFLNQPAAEPSQDGKRAALSRQAPAAPAAVDFEQWWLAEVAANGGVPIGADYKHWAKKGFELRGDARAPAAPAEAERVYLVATGETVGGLETYTRHKGAPPPLSDYERLYAAPTPAAPTQALLGWTRYEKARKLNPAQWAELHQRNIRGENFDDMIDALPATTQRPAPAGQAVELRMALERIAALDSYGPAAGEIARAALAASQAERPAVKEATP